jgi:Tol biopolymer transport system component/predicted Ser/Thr protein kinase
MPLSPGDKLGPHEILSPLGAGGMGEVYKARDTRLGRDVAIKISQEKFSDRFEREARSIAALNHPNICQLYDVGPNYLVMELIEGQPLRGPLPLETALDYARQIAEALNAAHEKSIVHRDLKPANILIASGVVKVLDFGLAKTADAIPGDPENSPTMTVSPTGVGMIVGTAAYMAPEQARGKPVDRRVDIWAFGVVLYEMLTGEKLFHGETVTDILAAVVKEDPDLTRVPARVRRLLQCCLEKNPKQRLQSIGDWRLLLDDAVAPARHKPAIAAWSLSGVLLLAFAAVAFLHLREKPPAAEVIRFDIRAPGTSTISGAWLSPDGRNVAFYVAQANGRPSLWIRSLDSLESRQLPTTAASTANALWSPDSRFLAYVQQGKFMKIDAMGGSPEMLCEVLPGQWRGSSWSKNGVIVFSAQGKGLMRVSDAGGVPSMLLAEGHTSNPFFLPDGVHFVYQRSWDAAQNSGIYLGSLDAKPEQQTARRLIATQSAAIYAPSPDPGVGYLLYIRDSTLLAQPFDTRKLELTGTAAPVTNGIAEIGPLQFSAVAGVLAYHRGASSPMTTTELTWFDRTGKAVGAVGEPGGFNVLSLSPDGARVAVSRSDVASNPNADVWLYDLSAGTSSRFTFDPGVDWMPVWSPDGSRIVWSATRGENGNLYHKPSNGAGADELLLKSEENKYPNDWSPDGRYLLFSSVGKSSDLWILPMTGDDRKPRIYLQTEFHESQARFSPDARWVAYTSNESGVNEVYVRPFPDASAGKWMVSKGGGNQPHWRRDGRELFYISADSKMMAVDVLAGPAFRSGVPKALFPATIMGGASATNTTRYDVTADGKKFLINSVQDVRDPSPITVVLNWQAGLRK